MTIKPQNDAPEEKGKTGELTTCRVCNCPFHEKPLLHYSNMPKAAQFLPGADMLAFDQGVDLDIRQCSGCGLVQLTNRPVSYYRDVVRAAAFSGEMKEFRIKQFGNFVRQYSLQGKNIIEIGCGRGEYLTLMKDAGTDACGLEHGTDAVEYCLQHGLKVCRGFVEKSDGVIAHAPFDAFFILNFLEHLPDPNTVCRGIYRNLSDDAVGLVEVPNFDMILRNNLFSEFIADHLLYFTKDTLTSALTQNGFEVVECSEIWHDYIISAVVRKKRKLDLSHFSENQAKLKAEIQKYIDGLPGQKAAVWGAGHQALTVLALADLSGKIRYIVDSAPFKQGKYSPATHIPIVSPGHLESDPVDAVIIMAASYSDEVAAILGKKFSRRMQVAILRDYGLEEIKYE